jgi:hypothetical protein
MSLQEQSDLVLASAQVLHVNGQSTGDTVAAARRLGGKLGIRATIIPGWGELQLPWLGDWSWSLPVVLAGLAVASVTPTAPSSR